MLERLKPEMDGVCAIIDSFINDSDPLIRLPVRQTLQNKGKLLRPILLVLTAKCGDYDERAALTTAAALELIHIASLIHDDIVDEGTIRRGSISVQSRFGKDAAVYAGDFTLARGIHILTKLEDIVLVKMFEEAMSNVCRGELWQHATRYKVVSTQAYIDVISHKTGALFGLSLEAGAYISGMAPLVCQELCHIGRMIGTAYQIYDDCLDYTFTNSKALKDTHKDIIHGNYTAPLLCAMEEDHSHELMALLDAPLTAETVEGIQKAVRRLRGPEIAMQYALDYFDKITDDTRSLSLRHGVDLEGLIDGLYSIIEIVKGASV